MSALLRLMGAVCGLTRPKRCNRFQPFLYINSINFSKVQRLLQIYYKKTEKPKKKLRVITTGSSKFYKQVLKI